MRRSAGAIAAAAVLVLIAPGVAAQQTPSNAAAVKLTADEMLTASAQALASKDEQAAAALLRALLHDPVLQVRNEARFRLAMIAAGHKNYTEAATWLRSILDEEPNAQRVRLELARVLGMMGDIAGARRELRQAQAGPLPPEVVRVVDQFSAALRERRHFGGSFEIALAPDSNVNRATTSDTVSTVIGDFVLNSAAKAHSGVGLAVRGTGYNRVPVSGSINLLSLLSFEGSLYAHSRFNDITAQVGTGPEIQLRKGRLQTQLSFARRWFGTHPYSDSMSGQVTVEHAVSSTAQVRGTAMASITHVLPNSAQSSAALQVSGSLEKAFSPRSGGSLTLSARREEAEVAPYSSWSGQVGVFGWRELGRTTLVGGASYAPLWADERLSIFPTAREDGTFQVFAGATMRQFTLHGFAPQVRFIWEHNMSNIEIYRYSRLRTEVGVVRAF